MLNPVISIKYMIAGYIVALIVTGGYLASLIARWRNLKRSLHDLEEMPKRE